MKHSRRPNDSWAAYRSEEGKCKFFSDEVNRMLLSVELKAQELTSAQRSTIYAHLASHLPCTKETLQKRAKKLRLDQEDGKLREPMQRLKDGMSFYISFLVLNCIFILEVSHKSFYYF
ncbi:UNVERIFIED_CONTAM: Ubn2 [Trichonephila clavipes]